jgi:type II secretory pathway pseudopilin PulG
MMSVRHGHEGFGLVEALVATAIFSFAVVASLQAFRLVLPQIQAAFSLADSQIRAYSTMEEVVATPNRENVFSGLVLKNNTAVGSGGPLTAKLDRYLFNGGPSSISHVAFGELGRVSPEGLIGLEVEILLTDSTAEDGEKVLSFERFFRD